MRRGALPDPRRRGQSGGRRSSELVVGGRIIEVDDLGFMVDPSDWDRDVAEVLADNNFLSPLTREHWRVIECIREYFLEFEIAPMFRWICKRTQLGRKRLSELFPSDCRSCMCKLAGLPEPTG